MLATLQKRRKGKEASHTLKAKHVNGGRVHIAVTVVIASGSNRALLSLCPSFSPLPDSEMLKLPWVREAICRPYIHFPSFLNRSALALGPAEKLHFPASLAGRGGQWDVRRKGWVELLGMPYCPTFFPACGLKRRPGSLGSNNLSKESSKKKSPGAFLRTQETLNQHQ